MTKFSIGDVDEPTQVTIVIGFHKYTRAAVSPEERNSGINKKVPICQLLMGKEKRRETIRTNEMRYMVQMEGMKQGHLTIIHT